MKRSHLGGKLRGEKEPVYKGLGTEGEEAG